MPPNPIIQAILEAGKKAVESARQAFAGEFHTGHLSPEHVHLPNDRQRPRLLDREELRRREQVRAAEDQAVFDALDNIAVEGFHTPSHNPAEVSLPRPRLTAAELAAMTPEERNRARAMEAANEIQELEDADILRTLEAAHVSPGLIPGTLNIQAPMQISRLAPNPNGLYDVNPEAQVGVLANLTREDLDRVRREIEQYDLRASAQPILVPGRSEGVMTLGDVRVNPEAIQRVLATQPEGIGVYNPRGISRLELYRESRTVEPIREIGNEGFVEVLVQAGRSERPPVHIPEELARQIREGLHTGVSMGTRITHVPVQDIGRTPPPFIEPSWVDTPARIDGPTPNWVNNAAAPNAVVPGVRGERVIFPTFEMAAMTVSMSEIRARRFDLIERNDSFGHTDYTQDIPSAALHKEPHRYEGPRPSAWEKITGTELIEDDPLV